MNKYLLTLNKESAGNYSNNFSKVQLGKLVCLLSLHTGVGGSIAAASYHCKSRKAQMDVD